VTGAVPFDGTNGPSILLAILTKDPIPPTRRGSGGPFPIPPALDDVLEEALMKNPNMRTQTVGALADAVGHAYGLEGDHHAWARTPFATLEQSCAEARARVMQPARPAVVAQADPFASRPVAHEDGVQPPADAMREAFAASREDELADANEAGLPSRRPPWVVATIVGLAALLLGGGLALAFVLTR
jgi:serine/threonine-protein kinase